MMPSSFLQRKNSCFLLLFFVLILLNACIPLHKKEPVPDERFRVTLEAFRLYQNNYVDEVNNRDLVNGAINGMLKSVDKQNNVLSPEIVQYIKELASTDIDADPFKSVSDAYVIIQSQLPQQNNHDLTSYAAIHGMQEAIDRHGNFHTPDEAKELMVDSADVVGGIGLEFKLNNNIMTIVSPIEGTPAEKAGLRLGDKILAIDGKSTDGMKLIDAAKRFRGKIGSKITLTIMRKDETFELPLNREKIVIQIIKTKVFQDIGYIRIIQFSEKTSEKLKAVLKEFQLNTKGLVIDLRENPGGLLNQAVSVSELFLDKGQLIAYTSGRRKEQNVRFIGTIKSTSQNFPIVVLVNKGTAAGSEILAAALQDWKRATVIGSTTFGMATIRTAYPLSDGSMLLLTTARFFTPKGQTVQDKGVTPDIIVEAPQDDIESLKGKGDPKYDTQLQKAIEILSTTK